MNTLAGIDVHVHPFDEVSMGIAGGGRKEGLEAYFGRDMQAVPLELLADQYRGRNMMAVLLATDDSTVSGLPGVPNDHVARAVRDHPDVFRAFGGVDPWKGRLALAEVRRCAEELGLSGLKFNPGRQQFRPNDVRFYPLWELASSLNLPCMFHTGMLGVGAGRRGGGGLKLDYVRPIPNLDDVAADFPDLTIISAHPAWPWQDEQLAMALHKPNVYIDLSGWSPKRFSPNLLYHMSTKLQDRILFGTDWPVLSPERWLEAFGELDIPAAVRSKIMVANASRLLGLQ
jgi:predicted TIM-barrel fold metal-dependent hydrolase